MKRKQKQFLFMILGNVLCGFSVGMFQFADFGIDPFNLGVMGLWHMLRLLDYGTFYLLLCLLLLAIDFFFLDRKKLGLGTIANMFLVGYVIEFSYWMWQKIFPSPALLLRFVFLGLALVLLCFSSALYYVSALGVSPYDAIPLTISERSRLSFKFVRVTADFLWVIIGLLGSQKPGIATLLIAFCLGPFIESFHPLCQYLLEGGNRHTDETF